MKNRKTKIQQFLAGLSGSPIFVCIGLWTFWEPDFIKARTGILDTLFDAGAVFYLLFGTVGISTGVCDFLQF